MSRSAAGLGAAAHRTAHRGGPMPTGDAVLLSRPSSGVRLITLNRPEVRNAMTEEMAHAWNEALDEITADRETRVLVVTGEGSSFCSGADLSWLDRGGDAELTAHG